MMFYRFLLFIFILFLSACQSIPEQEKQLAQKYWPEPPDQPRYFHEVTLRSNLDIEVENEDDMVKRLLTGNKQNSYGLNKPHSIAVSKGKIYVTDTALAQVHVFDIPRRRYFRIGYRREGLLAAPRGIAVDNSGNVYVVDGEQKRIVIYDQIGLYTKEILLENIAIRPSAIAVNSAMDKIYLVDSGGVTSDSHKVLVLNQDGLVIQIIGKRGKLPGEFNLPNDIAVTDKGELYILDAGNFRVQVLDKEGNYLREWGQVGNGLGHFARPRSLDVDIDGNVYVSDASFLNVQVFDSSGKLLLPIGLRSHIDNNGFFSLIAGIAVDETKRLYVIDQAFKKIEVYKALSEAEGKQLLLLNK